MLLPPRTRAVLTPDGEQVERRPVPGDLRWDGEVWLRWNARRWSRAAYSLDVSRLRDPAPLTDAHHLGAPAREHALDLALEDEVLHGGGVVRHRESLSAVVGRLRSVNHWGHGLLTVLTTLWAVVWIAMCLARREDRELFVVDAWGHVWAAPAGSVQVRRGDRTHRPRTGGFGMVRGVA